MNATYLDSSAIVKLVVLEPETDSLLAYLRKRPVRVSSALAKVEVLRALLAVGSEAQHRGEAALDAIELIAITDSVLDAAARLLPAALRSLDAIHLATAARLDADLETLVTYDKRMLEVASKMGLQAVAPGAS